MISHSEYEDYFLAAAQSNKSILHDPGSGKIRFIAINPEDLFAELPNGIDFVNSTTGEKTMAIFLLENFDTRVSGPDFGNLNARVNCGFSILKPCLIEDFEREKDIYEECRVIATQFLSKMIKDRNSLHFLKYFEPQTGLSLNPIGPLYDNLFGYRVQFTLNRATTFIFNSSEWQ